METQEGPGESKGSWGKDSWKTQGGCGQGIPLAPGCIDKPGSQLVQAEATTAAQLPSPLTPAPLLSLSLVF